MLPIVPPFFAPSRQAFVAQFAGNAGNQLFRENGIGPAYRVTTAEAERLMAVHDRYATLDRWSFRGFLLLVLVVVPLVKMLQNPQIDSWVGDSAAKYLFLLPVIFVPASSLWARSQLRRRLATLPVAAPALSRQEADAVVLAATSWLSLLLPSVLLPLALYAYKPAAAGWPATWTLGLVAFCGYFLLLAWQKYRLQTATDKLRTE